MQVVAKVAKNTAIVITGKVLRGLIEMACMVIMARYLDVGSFGLFAFVFAYLGFFDIITNLGLDDILVRQMSRDRADADKLAGNVLTIKIILSVLAIALASMLAWLMKYPPLTQWLIFLASLGFLLSMRPVYEGIFRIELKMEYPAGLEVVAGIVKLCVLVFLVGLKVSVAGFVAGVIAVRTLYFVVLRHMAAKFIDPRLRFDFKLWKYFFKEAWPLAATMAGIVIFTRISYLMLFHIKDKVALGYYSAAITIAEAFSILIASLVIPMFPVMAAYFKKSEKSFQHICGLAFKYAMLMIMPIAMMLSLLAPKVINLVYGPKFALSAPVLAVFIWSSVFVFFMTVQNNIFIAAGKQKYNLIFSLTTALLMVVFNALLIPRFGAIGAAAGSVIAYAWTCLAGLFFKKVRRYTIMGWGYVLKPFLATLAVGVFVYFTAQWLMVSIIGGVSIYFTIMVATGHIHKRDFREPVLFPEIPGQGENI